MLNDDLVSEFLYHDPDTGMVVTMTLDGDGFRPMTAMEEAKTSLEWDGVPMPVPQNPLEIVNKSLGDFIAKYARSFCIDAAEDLAGWDTHPQPQSPC